MKIFTGNWRLVTTQPKCAINLHLIFLQEIKIGHLNIILFCADIITD